MPTHFRSALAILLIAPLCAVAETPAERPWSLRPVVRPPIPVANTDGWARNPIDAFVWQRLAAATITPSSAANQRTLVRRAWCDLLGLPPGHLLPDADILAIVTEAVAIEKQFVTESLPCGLLGMNR